MVGDNKQQNKNSVEIEAYLKPSWVLASTNIKHVLSVPDRLSSDLASAPLLLGRGGTGRSLLLASSSAKLPPEKQEMLEGMIRGRTLMLVNTSWHR